MDVEVIKEKKKELNGKIAELLNAFEDETGVEVCDLCAGREVIHDVCGRKICKTYVVESDLKL